MSNFLVCFNAVMPIFLCMAVGFTARKAGIISRDDVPKINRIAFRVFIPAMVFYNIYVSDISSAVRPGLIAFAAAGVLIAFTTAALLTYRFEKIPSRRGVIIQGVFRSNFVIIGLPMALSLLGDADMGSVAILLAIIIPIYNVLAVVILSVNNGETPDMGKTLRNIAKNPLILGTLAGIACAALKIRLPSSVEKVIHDFCNVASPLMMFLLGAFFEFGNLGHARTELIWTVLGRLVLVPGVMLTAGYLLGFRGVEFVALIGVFAAPAATTSFPMAQQMGGDDKLAGNIVVITSAFCSFTLFLWCYIFRLLGAY